MSTNEAKITLDTNCTLPRAASSDWAAKPKLQQVAAQHTAGAERQGRGVWVARLLGTEEAP